MTAAPSILDTVCLDLGETLTYAHRRCVWVPEVDTFIHDRIGILTIILQKGRRSGSKVEVDHYAVQRVDQAGSNRWGFYLLNIHDAEQPDVYACRPAGAVAPSLIGCTCTAGNCRVSESCKHRDSLAALIEEGVI